MIGGDLVCQICFHSQAQHKYSPYFSGLAYHYCGCHGYLGVTTLWLRGFSVIARMLFYIVMNILINAHALLTVYLIIRF